MGKGKRKANRIQRDQAVKRRRKKRVERYANNALLVFHITLIIAAIRFSWQYSSVTAQGGEQPFVYNVFANIFFSWGTAGLIDNFSCKFRPNKEKPMCTYVLGGAILTLGAALAGLPILANDFWLNFIGLIAWIPINIGLGVLRVGIEHMKLDL